MNRTVYILAILAVITIVAFSVAIYLSTIENSYDNLYDSIYIKTKQGRIKGKIWNDFQFNNNNKVISFFNIPFAKPPINELRFKPPKFGEDYLHEYSWNKIREDGTEETRDATVRGNMCVQYSERYTDTVENIYQEAEDCLYLNVWTTNVTARNPVLVYFHGGSFYEGSGVAWRNDMSVIAGEHNLVTVSINYRLGTIGFLPFESVFNGKEAVGNFGLMDQYAALQWIQSFISEYGGDPDQVFISGMSAGGMSVSSHYAWEDSVRNNKIKGGISISDPFGIIADTVESAVERLDMLADKIGCKNKSDDSYGHELTSQNEKYLECFLNLTASQLISLEYYLGIPAILPYRGHISALFTPWSPIIDNNIQKSQRFDYIKNNPEKIPPTLFGFATEEHWGLVPYPETNPNSFGNDVTCAFYKSELSLWFGAGDAPKIKEEFPCSDDDQVPGYEQMKEIFNRYAMHCAGRAAYKENQKNYYYIWARPYTVPEDHRIAHTYRQCDKIACHGDAAVEWLFASEVLLTKYENNWPESKRDSKYPFWYQDGVSKYFTEIDYKNGRDWRQIVANFMKFGEPGNVRTKLESDAESVVIKFPEFWNGTNYQALLIDRDGNWHATVDVMEEKCKFFDELDSYGQH